MRINQINTSMPMPINALRLSNKNTIDGIILNEQTRTLNLFEGGLKATSIGERVALTQSILKYRGGLS